jgi:hypothetical protein
MNSRPKRSTRVMSTRGSRGTVRPVARRRRVCFALLLPTIQTPEMSAITTRTIPMASVPVEFFATTPLTLLHREGSIALMRRRQQLIAAFAQARGENPAHCDRGTFRGLVLRLLNQMVLHLFKRGLEAGKFRVPAPPAVQSLSSSSPARLRPDPLRGGVQKRTSSRRSACSRRAHNKHPHSKKRAGREADRRHRNQDAQDAQPPFLFATKFPQYFSKFREISVKKEEEGETREQRGRDSRAERARLACDAVGTGRPRRGRLRSAPSGIYGRRAARQRKGRRAAIDAPRSRCAASGCPSSAAFFLRGLLCSPVSLVERPRPEECSRRSVFRFFVFVDADESRC